MIRSSKCKLDSEPVPCSVLSAVDLVSELFSCSSRQQAKFQCLLRRCHSHVAQILAGSLEGMQL